MIFGFCSSVYFILKKTIYVYDGGFRLKRIYELDFVVLKTYTSFKGSLYHPLKSFPEKVLPSITPTIVTHSDDPISPSEVSL